MPKRRKPTTRDSKKAATSASKPKIELSLGEKLEAAGIVDGFANREDAGVHRVDCNSRCDRNGESKPDKRIADRDELNRAYMGVRRLQRREKRRVGKHEASIDAVGTDYRQSEDRAVGSREVNLLAEPGFDIRWDRDGDVTGLRRDFEIDELNWLFDNRFKPEATLDLHGTSAMDLDRKVARFVLLQYRRGVRRLLLVHGKGKHSEDGVGVLGDRLVRVLSNGRVSHFVRGFCTASLEHGGSGALAVRLIE